MLWLLLALAGGQDAPELQCRGRVEVVVHEGEGAWCRVDKRERSWRHGPFVTWYPSGAVRTEGASSGPASGPRTTRAAAARCRGHATASGCAGPRTASSCRAAPGSRAGARGSGSAGTPTASRCPRARTPPAWSRGRARRDVDHLVPDGPQGLYRGLGRRAARGPVDLMARQRSDPPRGPVRGRRERGGVGRLPRQRSDGVTGRVVRWGALRSLAGTYEGFHKVD